MQQTKILLSGFIKTISRLNLIIAYMLALVMLFFGGIMLYEAIARHFFNSPTTWAFEFSKMAFGFYMIWGGAYTMLCGEHVSMDLLYNKWPPRTKAIMDSVTYIFFMLFICTLLYLVTADAINTISFRETSNSTLAQPLYHWRASLVVGIILLILQGTAGFVKNLWFAIFEEELR
jgi:TRAP-type mannitol/chloroaromatic compound transport system permease small subunit